MLPFDVARCPGAGSEEEGWREGCEDCLRRTSPPHFAVQAWMEPPSLIVFECEGYIPPDEKERDDAGVQRSRARSRERST